MRHGQLTSSNAYFAVQDSAQTAFPGLFAPLRHGTKRQLFDRTWMFGKDLRLRIIGPQLSTDDLSVLLACLATVGSSDPDHANFLTPDEDPGSAHAEARRALAPTHLAKDKKVLYARTRLHRLCVISGYDTGGRDRILVLEALRRLSAATIFESTGALEWSSHLLGFSVDDQTGELLVALNYGSTRALLGLDARSIIDISEHLVLPNGTARALHLFLSGWIGPGHVEATSLEHLVRRVWPDKSPRRETERTRLRAIKNALDALDQLPGWAVEEVRTGGFHISRDRRDTDLRNQKHGPTRPKTRTHTTTPKSRNPSAPRL